MDKLGDCEQVKLEDLECNEGISFGGLCCPNDYRGVTTAASSRDKGGGCFQRCTQASVPHASWQGSFSEQAAGYYLSFAMHMLPGDSRHSLGWEQHLDNVHCPADVHHGWQQSCEVPLAHAAHLSEVLVLSNVLVSLLRLMPGQMCRPWGCDYFKSLYVYVCVYELLK